MSCNQREERCRVKNEENRTTAYISVYHMSLEHAEKRCRVKNEDNRTTK